MTHPVALMSHDPSCGTLCYGHLCPLLLPQVADDVFVMDFNPCVLSVLQAFGLALSSFRPPYMRE